MVVEDEATNDALVLVRDSGLTAGCMGCYVGITNDVVREGCLFGGGCVTDTAGCDCRTCQCEEGVVSAFASCSW